MTHLPVQPKVATISINSQDLCSSPLSLIRPGSLLWPTECDTRTRTGHFQAFLSSGLRPLVSLSTRPSLLEDNSLYSTDVNHFRSSQSVAGLQAWGQPRLEDWPSRAQPWILTKMNGSCFKSSDYAEKADGYRPSKDSQFKSSGHARVVTRRLFSNCSRIAVFSGI